MASCRNCGKEITHSKFTAYCNSDCRREYRRKAQMGVVIKIKTGVRTCPECGKEFEVYMGSGQRTKRYCSELCRTRAKSREYRAKKKQKDVKNEIRICPSCMKAFEYNPHKQSTKMYCSERCSNIARRKKRIKAAFVGPVVDSWLNAPVEIHDPWSDYLCAPDLRGISPQSCPLETYSTCHA